MRKLMLTLLMLLLLPTIALADEPEPNAPLSSIANGTTVTLEGRRGTVVDTNTILLEKSLSRSFDSTARNKYEDSSIKGWLNTEFKDSLANKEWVKDNSISLITEEEFKAYKEYLSPNVIGWLQDALTPSTEPTEEGEKGLFVENTWNYVKALMDGEIVGLSYSSNFFASPIVLELKNLEKAEGGYKLKKAFGKPRLIIPNDAKTNSIGEYSELQIGDKIRYSNTWWTLVDKGSKKLLGEFDFLNYYVAEDEEMPAEYAELNTQQFADGSVVYGEEGSLGYYLKNNFKSTFTSGFVTDVDVPTKAQYEAWKSYGLGTGWLVYENALEEGTKVYLVDTDGLVGVGQGETYPVRVLVKTIDGLYVDKNNVVTDKEE